MAFGCRFWLSTAQVQHYFRLFGAHFGCPGQTGNQNFNTGQEYLQSYCTVTVTCSRCLVVRLPGTTRTCTGQPKIMLKLSGGQPKNLQPKATFAASSFDQICSSQWIVKAKKNKCCVSKLPRAFVFRCAFDSAKFKVWIFFCVLNFFSLYFMDLLVKIYKKIYDRHNETLWTTDFFNSVFCLVSCSSKIKFQISKLWPTQIWHVCCSGKKKKTHLGQVFQSVTSFET